tara:strand:- start:39 stop:1046 length:1008 start_codon:yes stop_codon:yes gene_type:complete
MADREHHSEDLKIVEELKDAGERIRDEISKVIIGQQHVVQQLLTVLLANGHALLIGVPGLAKTLLINTLSNTLDLKFNRIQFTPDLMPSDITGTEILEEDRTTGHREFKFIRGPIFANVILADEVNRTPPKTQAALLQAMQEHEVTAAGESMKLDEPFFVLATQNPIEQEGTYPLPEAQLDRFMFSIYMDYPSRNEEIEIAGSTTSAQEAIPAHILTGNDVNRLQQLVRRVPVANHVVEYAVSLVRMTRPNEPDAPSFIRDRVSWGAGPRASQYLVLGAKARAVLMGNYTPTPEDVRALALPVLRHRLVTNFNADADGVSAQDIITQLVDEIKDP